MPNQSGTRKNRLCRQRRFRRLRKELRQFAAYFFRERQFSAAHCRAGCGLRESLEGLKEGNDMFLMIKKT